MRSSIFLSLASIASPLSLGLNTKERGDAPMTCDINVLQKEIQWLRKELVRTRYQLQVATLQRDSAVRDSLSYAFASRGDASEQGTELVDSTSDVLSAERSKAKSIDMLLDEIQGKLVRLPEWL
jgi:hypothetical protein